MTTDFPDCTTSVILCHYIASDKVLFNEHQEKILSDIQC